MVLQHPFARSAHQLALLARFLLVGRVWRWQALSYLGWVPQVWPLGGCGFRATSPHLRCESARRPSAGWAGLVAGLHVGLAFEVLLLPGFGVSSSSLQVPGHATSICDAGVK